MNNQDDIVERVKAASPIEAVMEEMGVSLTGHGPYRKAKEHDSLVVDLHKQEYYWNSTGEHGDVIEWVQQRNGWDFKQTIEFLCRRAGLEAPVWGHQNMVAAAATRAREEALDVAAGVFARWLWKSGDAPGTPLAYARGRGWSDETIKDEGLGWTGDWTRDPDKKMFDELKKAMDARCAGPSPAAIAILGYVGDCSKLGFDVAADWIDAKKIPSFFGRNMLVYPHRRGGRVKYLSGRNISQKIHYNLPSELVGTRQPYFNHCYSSKAEICVIVEGQADAISLAQWGIAGVALSGTSADNALLKALQGHQRLYVGLDDDKAGQNTCSPIAEVLGPMVRFVHWRKLIAGLVQTRKGVSVPPRSIPRGDELAGSSPSAHAQGEEGSQGPHRSAHADLGERSAAGKESDSEKPIEEFSDEDLKRMAEMAKDVNSKWEKEK